MHIYSIAVVLLLAGCGLVGKCNGFVQPIYSAYGPIAASGYSTSSRQNTAESSESSQSQESSNRGYSRQASGFPYGLYGGAVSGYDQSSKSASSNKASRSLSREESSNAFSSGAGLYGPAVVGGSGYSSRTSVNAAESSESSQSRESSNQGSSKQVTGGPFGLPRGIAYGESRYDQNSRSSSSSKKSRSLNKQDSSTAYNSGLVTPGIIAPAVLGSSGWSTTSKLNAAENTENRQSQESSNNGWSRRASGLPTGVWNGPGSVTESGVDQRSRSDSSDKRSRSLNREDSTSAINSGLAPSVLTPAIVSGSAISTNSRLNAAENTENRQSQESSNNGWSRQASGLPTGVWNGPGSVTESGIDQRTRSDSSDKRSRSLNREDSTTAINSGLAPSVLTPAIVSGSAISANSRLNAAENTENRQSQESSNNGWSRQASGLPTGVWNGPGSVTESGIDQRTRSDSSDKRSRSLNREDSTTAYNSGVVAPGLYVSPVLGASGFSSRSKINSAESSESSQSQESSNRGFSNLASGLPGLYGSGAFAGSGFSQVSKSSSSSKKSRSLSKESSSSAFNSGVVAPGILSPHLGSASSFSTSSKLNAAESSESSQSQASSNRGYSRQASGLPAFGLYGGGSLAESGYGQSSKSSSSSKASRSLNKENSASAFNQLGYPGYSLYGWA